MKYISKYSEWSKSLRDFYSTEKSLKKEAIDNIIKKMIELNTMIIYFDFSNHEVQWMDDETGCNLTSLNILTNNKGEWENLTVNYAENSEDFRDMNLSYLELSTIEEIYDLVDKCDITDLANRYCYGDDITLFNKIYENPKIDWKKELGQNWTLLDSMTATDTIRVFADSEDFQRWFLTKHGNMFKDLRKKVGINDVISEEFSYLAEGEAIGFFKLK